MCASNEMQPTDLIAITLRVYKASKGSFGMSVCRSRLGAGLEVENLREKGFAACSGIQRGDVLLSVAGHGGDTLKTQEELFALFRSLAVDQVHEFVVSRTKPLETSVSADKFCNEKDHSCSRPLSARYRRSFKHKMKVAPLPPGLVSVSSRLSYSSGD